MKTYLNSLLILVTIIAGAQADHSCMFAGLLEKSVTNTPRIMATTSHFQKQMRGKSAAGNRQRQLWLLSPL